MNHQKIDNRLYEMKMQQYNTKKNKDNAILNDALESFDDSFFLSCQIKLNPSKTKL